MQKTDFLKSIQEAKAQKNYDLMLVNAKTAVQAFPSDGDLQELLHDAQGYYVNQKLESDLLETLEKQEDWQGLQAIYLKLLSVFPDSKKLHNLLDKVRINIEKKAKKAKVEFYKNAEEQIKVMIKVGQFDDAESACYEIIGLDPNNSTVIRLLAKVQHHIDQEIESALSLYYKSAVPNLKREYGAHKEDYIQV